MCTCAYKYTMSYMSSLQMYALFFLAFFGLFGSDSSGDDDDDDPTKLPPSVKRYLLKAHGYRRSGGYQRAERECHQALEVLAASKHSTSQAYIEGRAYILDTVSRH